MQLNHATESAIRVLVQLTRLEPGQIASVRELRAALGGTTSYLSKVVGALVRARVLTAQRGAHGGVALARPAKRITLLEIVEAVEGQVGASYCTSAAPGAAVCGFHGALVEVREAMVRVLGRWTLAALAEGDTRGADCKLRLLTRRGGPAPARRRK